MRGHKLSTALPGKVFFSKDEAYAEFRDSLFSTYQTRFQPHCVVRPSSTQDVCGALRALADENRRTGNKCEFTIRSGGHAPFPGGSTSANGIVLDLRQLNDVAVSDDRATVTFGPGNRWRDVYGKLDAVGLAVPGGRVDTVGVGGLITGGGLSFFAPRMGFVCDNMLEFEVVLASGQVVKANTTEHQDLWSALRSGSNNFGVVTKFTLRAVGHTNMWGGQTTFTLKQADKLLPIWHDFFHNPNSDDKATSLMSFGYNESIGLSGIALFLDYTEPVKDPAVFKDFLAIEQLSSTRRITNLTDIVTEMGTFSPLGFYHRDTVATFKCSLPVLRKAWALFQPTISQVKMVNGAVHSLVFHGLPRCAFDASRARGENSLGLEIEHEPLVICQVTSAWKDAKDCEFMLGIGHHIITDLEVFAKELDAWHPYKFLNYANDEQDPISSYGAEAVRSLWMVSQKYDPTGMFQEAVPGGFKLPKEVNQEVKI